MIRPEDTRTRLLRAAAEVFAEVGFEAATTRAICARAGANVALINYHFGDKSGLYTQVLQQCLREAPMDELHGALESHKSPEAIMRDIIRIRLRAALEGDKEGRTVRLLRHELATPSPAMIALINTHTLPFFRRMLELVGSILGLPPDDEETRMCLRSVAGQIIFYVVATPIVTRIWPDEFHWAEEVDRIAEHIANFSMAYMRESARRRAEQKGTPNE